MSDAIDRGTPTSFLVQIVARHETQCMLARYGIAPAPTAADVAEAAAAVAEMDLRDRLEREESLRARGVVVEQF